jgi:hypothetical protein
MSQTNLKLKRRTRVTFHFKRQIPKKTFSDSLTKLEQDWNHLINCHDLAKDPKFLRRMAINIQQIHYDVKRSQKGKNGPDHLLHFLSTPLGAPFVAKTTLLQAAESFSEQEPKHSDLSELLSCCAAFKSKLWV